MKNYEAKVVVEEALKKLQESIKKEVNYFKEIADDRIALKGVLADQEAGTELDKESGYVTYNEWVTQLSKEIKTGESSLARIEKEKAEIVAFDYFIKTATDEDEEPAV